MKTIFNLFWAMSIVLLSACAEKTGHEEENKAVARRWFEEGWNKHNLDKVDEFFTANFVSHSLGFGFEEWKQFVSTALIAFPDIHFTVEDQIAEGDKVTTRWTYRATHQGEFMGIPATGKQVTVTGMNISRHENGKYVEDWGNWDGLGLLQQLGAISPPAQNEK